MWKLRPQRYGIIRLGVNPENFNQGTVYKSWRHVQQGHIHSGGWRLASSGSENEFNRVLGLGDLVGVGMWVYIGDRFHRHQ